MVAAIAPGAVVVAAVPALVAEAVALTAAAAVVDTSEVVVSLIHMPEEVVVCSVPVLAT